MAYSNPWVKKECQRAKWLKTWDFDCNQHFDTYEQFYSESLENLAKKNHILKTDDSISSVADNQKEPQKISIVNDTFVDQAIENGNDPVAIPNEGEVRNDDEREILVDGVNNDNDINLGDDKHQG